MLCYVEPFPPTGARYQLPVPGQGANMANHPVWSARLPEIIYSVGPGLLASTRVSTGWTVEFGTPSVVQIPGAAAERAIALNPLDADTVGLCALFLSCAGDDDRAMELFERAVRLKPQHPGWYHFPPFTTHFKRRDYAAALADAKHIALPQLPTVHISAAAAAARAGSVAEAQAAVEALRRLGARFLEPEAARQAVALWIWDEGYVRDLVDGLPEAIVMSGTPPAS